MSTFEQRQYTGERWVYCQDCNAKLCSEDAPPGFPQDRAIPCPCVKDAKGKCTSQFPRRR